MFAKGFTLLQICLHINAFQLNSLGEGISASRGPRGTEQRSQPTELIYSCSVQYLSCSHVPHSLLACSFLLAAFCSNPLPKQHLWIHCSCIPCPTDFPIQTQNSAYKAELELPRVFIFKLTILRTKPAILTAQKSDKFSLCAPTPQERG